MRTFLIGLFALACSGPHPQGGPTAPSLSLAADDGPPQTEFQLRAVDQLMVRYRLRALEAGITWVTLELVMPDGSVQQRRHLPFAEAALRGRIKVESPDGVPHPIDVLSARRSGDDWLLDTSILVGGSNLQRHPLFGRWMVRAMVDGRPDTQASVSFEFQR